MDEIGKIQVEDLIEEIKTALKDIFIAQTRKYLDEIHLKFPNGQKFIVAVWEEKENEPNVRALAEWGAEGLSGEDYNRWFEEHLTNWIAGGLYMLLGIDTTQENNVIYVPLKNGRLYTVTIQKG